MNEKAVERSVHKHKHRLARQRIMEILRAEYPGPVDQKIIWFSLDDLGLTMSEESVVAELSYLQDRGYVKRETVGDKMVVSTVYYLTPEGLDVLDGTITNGGIAW